MSPTQYNVGDPDKCAWRVRGEDLSGWVGSYLKEASGKYFGQLVGYNDSMEAKTEHQKQKQNYSSMAASSKTPQSRPLDRQDMQLDVQAARGSKSGRE